MPKNHRPLAVAALTVAALAPAAAAQAATKQVTLGYPGKPPKGTPETAAFVDFFPRKVTIHAGDKVRYRVAGLGVVYSGPKSGIQPFAQLDPASPVAGVNDPAGGAFWFNGQPTPAVNPAYLAKKGDAKVRKGQKDVDHNALAPGAAPPYTLSFSKPGTYKVYDAIHPKVTNTVVVKPRKAHIPSAAADRAAVAKQLTKLAKEARKLAAVKPAANTVLVGNDSRRVGFFQFFPGDLQVQAGQAITLDAGASANDVHDLVIGPQDYMKQSARNVFQPGPAGFALLGSAVYPSQPAGAPLTFDGTQNGGFLSSGALDSDPSTPLPRTTSITFTKPGTYHYVCLFHSDGVHGMEGTITVK